MTSSSASSTWGRISAAPGPDLSERPGSSPNTGLATLRSRRDPKELQRAVSAMSGGEPRGRPSRWRVRVIVCLDVRGLRFPEGGECEVVWRVRQLTYLAGGQR